MLPRSLPAFGSVMQMAPIFSPRSADRKSTRLNSSHSQISYAVFCLKKKKMSPNDRDPVIMIRLAHRLTVPTRQTTEQHARIPCETVLPLVDVLPPPRHCVAARNPTA